MTSSAERGVVIIQSSDSGKIFLISDIPGVERVVSHEKLV